MHVHIIGGGIAGLSLAVALQTRAAVSSIRVYERETSATLPRKLGHGLVLMANGISTLDALGCRGILDGSTPLRRVVIQGADGALLREEAMDEAFSVTRASIIEGLRARVSPTVIELARRCVRIRLGRSAAGRARVRALEFADGGALIVGERDLVVDASGWRSPLCAALNPGFVRGESRVTEIVTSTAMPSLAQELGETFVKTLLRGRGLAFGLLAPTSERVIGFLQFDRQRITPPPAGAGPEALGAFLRAQVGDAPGLVQRYLEGVDLSSAHVWRPVDAELPPRLCCDNAIMIGDAAHPLLPFTSQGVSAALEDSVILADALADAGADDEMPALLAGVAADRRGDVGVYIDQGRGILADFVDDVAGLPYVESEASRVGEHLALPSGGLHGLFGALDRNANGILEPGELALALDHLGLGEAADDLFVELDRDGSGGIDRDELRRGVRGEVPKISSPLARLRGELSPRGVATLLARVSGDRQVQRVR